MMRFHHVGVVCANIQKTAAKLTPMLGAVASETVFDPNQNAELCMLDMPDGSRIELVAGPVVAGYLKVRTSYYHVCYEVPDIAAAVQEFKSNGAVIVSPPKPAVLFGGRQVSFVQTPMGLVELLDAGPSPE